MKKEQVKVESEKRRWARVEWVDARQYVDSTQLRDSDIEDPVRAVSVGIVASRGAKFIALALSEFFMDGPFYDGEFRQVTVIPMCCVKKIEFLERERL
jgi:hypothetical protein